MRIKFEHSLVLNGCDTYSREQIAKMVAKKRPLTAQEKELYYEFGIEPKTPKHKVKYTIICDTVAEQREQEAIKNALDSIVSAFYTQFDFSYDDLWKIVKGNKDAYFYADCKNYVVEISVNGASLEVEERFDYPHSVDFTGNFIKTFLWAYLTMRESPAAPFLMEVGFKADWIIFY